MAAEDIAADFIRRHEGCVLTAYQDSGGVWTIGYGATGVGIQRGVVWTLAQAEDRLTADIRRFANGVRPLFGVTLTDKQAGALISFAFNLGLHALESSTLRSLTNSHDFLGAAQEFPRWCRVGGNKLKGLLIRRLHEAALFLEGAP